MTDVPPDNGAPGVQPVLPSEPPVVRRSNFTPAPPDAEPPTFDDDLLADAMAAEVRPYTSPIRLPWTPPADPPVTPPAAQAAMPAPVAPAPATSPAVAPARVAPVSPPPVQATPAATAPRPGSPEDEIMRALGTGSILEALERLENEIRRVSNGEPPTIDLSQLTEAATAAGRESPPEPTPPPAAPHVVEPAPDAASATAPPVPVPPVEADSAVTPPPPVESAPPTESAPPAELAPPVESAPPAEPVALAWLVPPAAAPDAPQPETSLPETSQPEPEQPEAVPQPPADHEPSPVPVGSTAPRGPLPGAEALGWVPTAPEAEPAGLDEPAETAAPEQAPIEQVEVEPVHVAPVPVPPVQVEPVQVEPVQVDSVQVESAQLQPTPVEPVHAEPAPVQPQPLPAEPPAELPTEPPQAFAWLFPAPGAAAGSMPEAAAPEAAAPEPPAPDAPAPEPARPEAAMPEAPAPEAPAPQAWPAPPSEASWDLTPPSEVDPVIATFAPPSEPPAEPPVAFPVDPAGSPPPFLPPPPSSVVSHDEGPQLSVAVPYSTEPPVGPESPDWLDAPPPVYSPPPLVEPPAFVDAPNAALDPIAPITANTMAQLPVPLPTSLPNLADRAELPPPPGYENIPILPDEADPASTAGPLAPSVFAPPSQPRPDPGPPPVVESMEQSSLDHDDDDVIDPVDRVIGAAAAPVIDPASAAPLDGPAAATVEPLVSEPVATVRLAEGEPALVDQKPQLPSAVDVESAGAEPTPLDQRAGRAARLFWLWFAANSSVVSMGLGAVLLGTGMSLRQAIVATLAGVAISFLPLGLGTLAGKWSGQPTMVVSRASFGHAGNILPALLAVVTRIFWGGVLLWVLATAVAEVLVGAGLDAGLGTTVWQLVGLVVGFVIVTVIAVFGYGMVAKVQLVLSIVSALLIVGAGALTFQRIDVSKALTVPDGSWILVIAGAALVFSVVGLAWVHSSSDLARYQRPGSSGGASMLWATFGATLPPFVLIAWGALLAASDPDLARQLRANPLAAIAGLLPAWYPAPLLAAAALGLLSAAVLTIYSGGFALQSVGLRVRRSFGTLLTALLVLGVSAGLLFGLVDFGSIVRDLITTIAVPVAAWAGIFATEMMIRTRNFHAPSLLAPGGVYPQVRWVNLLGLLAASAIGFGFVTSSVSGLEWEGFLFEPLGFGASDPFTHSEIGIFIALLLGVLIPIVGGIPAIRRQERDAEVASELEAATIPVATPAPAESLAVESTETTPPATSPPATITPPAADASATVPPAVSPPAVSPPAPAAPAATE